MKYIICFILLLILPRTALMSGKNVEHSLSSVIKQNSLIFSVKIFRVSSISIKELLKEGPEVSKESCFLAVVEEVIYANNTQFSQKEPWKIIFKPEDKHYLKSLNKKDNFSINKKDTIAITHGERINYSYIYYVRKLHKIFYYNTCKDIVHSPDINKRYIFISSAISKKNLMFYGGIETGIFEDTKENRAVIKEVISQKPF